MGNEILLKKNFQILRYLLNLKKTLIRILFLIFIFSLNSFLIGLKEIKFVKNSPKGIWQEKKKLVLKEMLSIGVREGDQNLMFHEPMDLEVDENGNIYVLEKGNYRIQKFDKNGKFIVTIGKKGQGPGEILDSFDIELDNDGNILVFDLGNGRVSKFDSNGLFISSFKPKCEVFKGAIDNEGNIYFYSQYKGKLIHKYDRNGNYISSFMDEISIEPKRIEPHTNTLGAIEFYNEKIYLSMIYPYTIYVFEKNGELIQKIQTDAPYSSPPFLSPEGVVITNFLIAGISFSKEGFIFLKANYLKVPSNWREKLKELSEVFLKSSFFDIFDSNGSYLLHQEIPDYVWGFKFDKNGHLYMIKQEEDFWRVIKFSIEFK